MSISTAKAIPQVPPLSLPDGLSAEVAGVRAGAVLSVDLDAIVDNYRLLRSKGPQSVCAAVLKADAYGLGAERVGPALAAAGCRQFFVAHLDEGIALRRALPDNCAIYVLHGPMPGAEAEFLRHMLRPVLNGLEQIEAWRTLARKVEVALPAAVQVDSGMARLGLSPEELQIVSSDRGLLNGITLSLVLSHLSWAEIPEHPANAEALSRFKVARAMLPAAPASFANSSGVFLGSDYHFELLRPGAALYGLCPQPGKPNPLKPVVTLRGKVIQTRAVQAGTPVGYNGRYVSHAAGRIATVGVGYADGFLRCLGNKASASVRGHAVPIVGAVSMDLITLDASTLPFDLRPGELVDLIGGEAPSPDAVAAEAKTIGYEILTSLGSRYHRTYQGGAGAALPNSL
ncbi:MAG TPA: alanine racemase [Candidatus Sulfotelmatobacter sp.]|jgi:alanine racemase|nr:alanine racemase [Candidatus Sulfotelmatobacter sp.]